MMRIPLSIAWLLSLAALSLGCSQKIDAVACDKLRGEAFEMLNKAQHCNGDNDCRPSAWPGCSKPLSEKTHGAIQPLSAAFTKGECEEPKSECREPLEVYCKQGLCVVRELAGPGSAAAVQ